MAKKKKSIVRKAAEHFSKGTARRGAVNIPNVILEAGISPATTAAVALEGAKRAAKKSKERTAAAKKKAAPATAKAKAAAKRQVAARRKAGKRTR